MTNFSRFWSKVIEIATLTIPFILLIFGVDVTPAIDGLGEVGLHLGALIIAAKDLYQLIAGYFTSEPQTFKEYTAMTYLEFERAAERVRAMG